MIHYFKKLYNPAIFQGNLNKTKYFEGWYFKMVSQDGKISAFIPGVSLTKENPHCFIQYIDGNNGNTFYNKFPLDSFHYNKEKFQIQIGQNYFSENELELNIQNKDFSSNGKVSFINVKKLQSKFFSPGIMGWYSFVPFMECYHGLVSMNHELQGSLNINDKPVDFAGGKGYIEKDWGTSFPSSWIWIQSNHFKNSITSFMFSIAKIPWLTGEFDGFLCVMLVKDQWLRFATYTGAKVTALKNQGKEIHIELHDKKYQVKIDVKRESTGVLAAPVFGAMDRSIHESINSQVQVEVHNKKSGETIIDEGIHVGCEVVGDYNFEV